MSYDLSIVQLRETAGQFRASLPIPDALQLCVETDTGRAFAGDGATVITALQDLKLTGEERRDADLAWLGMQLSDDRDEVGSGGGGGGGTIEHDPFGYSATTNPSGIGIGELRFNSTTFGSITKMYVSDNDQNSVDLVAEQSIMTSGVAKLYKNDGGKLSFQVTRMVDQSGYFEYDVLPLSGTMPTVGEVCYVDFVPDAPGVRVYEAILVQTTGSVTENRLFVNSVGTVNLTSGSTGTVNVNYPDVAGTPFLSCTLRAYADGPEALVEPSAPDGNNTLIYVKDKNGVPVDNFSIYVSIKL